MMMQNIKKYPMDNNMFKKNTYKGLDATTQRMATIDRTDASIQDLNKLRNFNDKHLYNSNTVNIRTSRVKNKFWKKIQWGKWLKPQQKPINKRMV